MFAKHRLVFDACAYLLRLQALATLADQTEGDVRCCLNTLQFLGRQKGAVRSSDVATACAGHKDIATSAFSVWQQLLWKRVRSVVCHDHSNLSMLQFASIQNIAVPPSSCICS